MFLFRKENYWRKWLLSDSDLHFMDTMC